MLEDPVTHHGCESQMTQQGTKTHADVKDRNDNLTFKEQSQSYAGFLVQPVICYIKCDHVPRLWAVG